MAEPVSSPPQLGEERFRTVFQETEQGIVIQDQEGQIVDANPAAARILGLTREQLLGRTSIDPRWQTMREDGSPWPGEEHPIMVAIRTGQPVRGAVMGVAVPGDDQLRWILVSAAPLAAEGAPGFRGAFATFADVTGRKRGEQALREAEWKFRALFEKGPLAVAYHRMLYDAAGAPADYLFLDANQQYQELTGVDPRGRTVRAAFPGIELDPFDWIGTFGRVARTGETIRFEQHLQANDRWYDCVGYQYRPDHFVAAFIEITERKRLEQRQLETQQQLAQSRKLDAIGQLAGGVAHDFNNMLTGILGAADALESAPGLDAEALELVQTIATAGRRAAELTSKLLAFGRKTSLRLTRVEVDGVLDEAVALLARTVDKRCALRLVKGAERHAVVGDATLVQNVFINLGVNASHAMPDGGTLTFSTRNVALDEAHCAASRFALAPGLFLEVEVRDTGCGIQPEDLPRIFEPFFTTKGPGKGTGLGLSAVYGSVLDLHGSITVSSEPGRGSAFLVHLPVTEAAAAALATPSALVRGSGTVLIIDDEEVVRTTAQALLARLGYQVLVAEDGAAGLQLFERRRPEVEVVLLDMTMPGLSGRETFRRLRQLDPSARIVVCSAFSKEGELEQLQAQGLTGFLRKPFRLAELSLALDEARRAPARA